MVTPSALMQPKAVTSPHKCRVRQKRKEGNNMNKRIQKRLEAYKHELNSRIGFDNRRRWTQRVLADIEKSALTVNEKAVLTREIIKVYEA